VYINRRGYAPTLICTACGWIAPCHSCDARMTVHQRAGRLRCHHCGADEALPENCPRCGHAVKPVGQGTERIEETLAKLFPAAGLARLDRDSARTSGGLESVVEAMVSGTARILVGTQMITKGHHFPEVSMVAVLNADQGLFSTDFRAAERLAQTIVQVAGRAGRDERQGEVLIQTEYPDHPLLQHLVREGYEGFAAVALAERQAAHWPPFSRLAALRCSATEMDAAMRFLSEARALAGRPADVTLLGPVAAGMARRAGRHHAQLLVESPSRAALHRFLDSWLQTIEALPRPQQLRWSLDVDPLDTQ
jgi:primosomal protein N' (replication factor Y)